MRFVCEVSYWYSLDLHYGPADKKTLIWAKVSKPYFGQACEPTFFDGQFLILVTEKRLTHVFLICCFSYSTPLEAPLKHQDKIVSATQLLMNHHYYYRIIK